jgi:hypothetical protein
VAVFVVLVVFVGAVLRHELRDVLCNELARFRGGHFEFAGLHDVALCWRCRVDSGINVFERFTVSICGGKLVRVKRDFNLSDVSGFAVNAPFRVDCDFHPLCAGIWHKGDG